MSDINTENLPKVNLKLVGMDGNAFTVLGNFKNAARKAKWTNAQINTVLNDAMSGDYDHLLAVVIRHTSNPLEDEENEGDDDDYYNGDNDEDNEEEDGYDDSYEDNEDEEEPHHD